MNENNDLFKEGLSFTEIIKAHTQSGNNKI